MLSDDVASLDGVEEHVAAGIPNMPERVADAIIVLDLISDAAILHSEPRPNHVVAMVLLRLAATADGDIETDECHRKRRFARGHTEHFISDRESAATARQFRLDVRRRPSRVADQRQVFDDPAEARILKECSIGRTRPN